MGHLVVGFFLAFAAFAALGFGPTLWALRGPHRWALAMGLGPAVGLAFVTVGGTALILSDRPVSRWVIPVLVVGLVVSQLLVLRVVVNEDAAPSRTVVRGAILPALVFLVTAGVALAPESIGGLQYSILRGNGTDSFNYVTVAGYLDHEPLSWSDKVDAQMMVERHPSYDLARGLLSTRWATMMLLAFASHVASQPAYRFELSFSVLSLLLAFGPAYLWCRLWMKLGQGAALLTAATLCVGFWGQFLVDERADAHQNAVPILVAIGALILHLDAMPALTWRWREHLLLGLLGTALLFIYPEVMAFTVLGLAAFLALRFARTDHHVQRYGGLACAVLALAVMALPMWTLLVRFVAMQFRYAQSVSNNWEQYYFPWLYSSPLTGLWGLGPYVQPGGPASSILDFVLVALGVILTFALAHAIAIAGLREARTGVALAALLSGAALLQSGYLLAREQLWAAGKGVSFGFPFLILAIVGTLPATVQTRAVWQERWRQLRTLAVWAFLILQGGLALWRPLLASAHRDYEGYISGHGEYRQHQWDLGSIEPILKSQPGLDVWTALSNSWVDDYVALALGWDVHLVQLGRQTDSRDSRLPGERPSGRPDYVLLDRATIGDLGVAAGGEIVAEAPDFVLVRPTADLLLASIDNPNGVEGPAGGRFTWLGDRPSRFRLIAFADGCARLAARFLMGPSRPDLRVRHLTVTAPGALPAPLVVSEGEAHIDFRTTVGENVVELKVEDVPNVMLPTDPRPLLLQAGTFRLTNEPCAVR